MDVKTSPRDEYLHEPADRRLWNESYFFDFNTDDVMGFTRLGFQPYERRVNAWFFAVHDGTIYWYRDENLPIERCFGLHLDTNDIELSYVPREPYVEWDVAVDANGWTAETPEPVLAGPGERASVGAEFTFTDPLHEALDIDLLVDSQHHYDHAGRIVGEVVLDGTTVEVDGMGYRDHSWGYYRDWTPGEWGHLACFAQFPSGDCFTLIASTNPGDEVHHTYGYHANAETSRPIRDASVEWNDGYGRDERAEAWARGDYPTEVEFTLEFDDGRETLRCTPWTTIPIGYEDRNWALSDTEAPWLKSIINRMPADCTWNGQNGHAWPEELLPI